MPRFGLDRQPDAELARPLAHRKRQHASRRNQSHERRRSRWSEWRPEATEKMGPKRLRLRTTEKTTCDRSKSALHGISVPGSRCDRLQRRLRNASRALLQTWRVATRDRSVPGSKNSGRTGVRHEALGAILIVWSARRQMKYVTKQGTGRTAESPLSANYRRRLRIRSGPPISQGSGVVPTQIGITLCARPLI